ncbi:MAG: DNA polymerase III subunit gamma/tau [Actinobacteria bacterium]|nr:DNA polymerase III subunit gamma/tau [Actinomycetota bacterium]
MEKHLSLYRKWRPQDFESVVGQVHITQTLKNEISKGDIAHAYLFCGPRGTGKTSTARIFAKALNCIEGPTPNPCGKCENCLSVLQGTSLDLIELDAASNRGIDDIREIINRVGYSPSKSRFKVYILDEAHMLTTPAVNAFLKTLEEPPEHVVFILATTEPHQIPLTLQSRCQRFDFRPLSQQDIVKKLMVISDAEGIKASDEALQKIALYSYGSQRDAETALDQIAAYSGGEIKSDDVEFILGIIREDVIVDFLGLLAQKDIVGAIDFVNRLFEGGQDLLLFCREIIETLNEVRFVVAVGPVAAERLNLKVNVKKIAGISGDFSIKQVDSMIEIFSKCYWEIKREENPRIWVDVAILECSTVLGGKIEPEVIEKVPEVKKSRIAEVVREEIPEESQMTQQGKPIESGEDDLSIISGQWDAVLKELKESSKKYTAVCLNEGIVKEVRNSRVVITFTKDKESKKAYLDRNENKGFVESVLNKVTGKSYSIECRVADEKEEGSDLNKIREDSGVKDKADGDVEVGRNIRKKFDAVEIKTEKDLNKGGA